MKSIFLSTNFEFVIAMLLIAPGRKWIVEPTGCHQGLPWGF
jgi:hypothetical protein